MSVEYTSPGSTRHFYGPRPSPTTQPDPAGARESYCGNFVEVEYNFTYDNLPAWTAENASDALQAVIPPYSLITDAYLLVQEVFAGGTALEVGTFQAVAGTAVAADGIIPASVGVLANLDTAGDIVYGTGTQVANGKEVGATGIISAAGTTGAVNTVIGVVATGTFTAGRARLVVRYLPRVG